MDKQEIKKEYIKLIKNIEGDSVFEEGVIKFIESYDGTNWEDFEILVLSVIGILRKYGDLEIVAGGYEELLSINEDFNKQLNVIKGEYADLESGKVPLAPPVDTGVVDTSAGGTDTDGSVEHGFVE